MATRADSTKKCRFDPFEVDLSSGDIWKHGTRLRLQEQPFQVLRVLLQRPGEIASREELKQMLWPGDTFVDFDDGLNTAIKKIRDLLGDSAESPRYIETIPRRGYRFIAPVTVATAGGCEAAPAEPRAGPAPPGAGRGLKASRVGIYVALTLLLVVAAGMELAEWRRRDSGGGAAPRIESVAVLPLRNLGGDPAQQYLADGTTMQLITTLTKISNLRVISWASVRGYANTNKPLPEIAKELNVDGIIDGSLEHSGDRVKINIQLIHPPSGRNLWAEGYDRQLRDILSLQDEVAASIAREVRVALTPQDRVRLSGAHPVDPEAYLLYTRGRSLMQRWTPETWRSARQSFHDAIDKDPNYAAAYAGLAETYITGDHLDPQVSIPLARTSAAKALSLDDTESDAHVAVAQVKYMEDWDFEGSEKEFRRAIELNPGDTLAHHLYSHLLLAMGRYEESLQESELYVKLDPLSPSAYEHLGFHYQANGQYQQAIVEYRKSALLDPSWESSHALVADCYRRMGMSQEALAEYERAMALAGTRPEVIKGLRAAFERGGWKGYWSKSLSDQVAKSKHEYVSPYVLATQSVLAGNTEDAFRYLQKAFATHDDGLTFIKLDHDFDSLHSDPRYAALLREVGLPVGDGPGANARLN